MDEIKKEGNNTFFYLDGRLLLTITELGNHNFLVENSDTKIQGKCFLMEDNKTCISLELHQIKGKNGRWYNTKKLAKHDMHWFDYILKEYGFVK